MELLWYSNGADESGKKYTEMEVDTGILSNPTFYEAPFALSFGKVREEAMSELLFPEPDGTQSDNGGKDTTSLRIGERGIINPLWQYNENADPRTAGATGVNYGRVYNTTIRPNNPIVFIQPGKPKFNLTSGFADIMGGGKKEMDKLKQALTGEMLKSQPTGGSFSLESIAGELAQLTGNKGNPQKFYDFQPNWCAYRTYVAALCDDLMVRMGIYDWYSDKSGGGKFSLYNSDNGDILSRFLKYYGFFDNAAANNDKGDDSEIQAGFLPFRVEKTTDAGDSFNNTTGESTAASLVKGNDLIDKAKEARYLLGSDADSQSNLNVLGKAAGAAFNLGSNVAENINENAGAMIKSGGNLLFPEIWKESTMSKSLSIVIKLHSPYADPVCYYENVIFPLACLLCLSLPEQTGSAVYASPPLVRLRSRGWFSCDMGMVESISIKRGQDKNDWTNRRLPRTVEVTLNIKDMFGTMMLSLMGKTGLEIFAKNNTALRDYLNTIGGLDTFSESRPGTKLKNTWKQIKIGAGRMVNPRAGLYNVGSSIVSRVPVLGKVTRDWF